MSDGNDRKKFMNEALKTILADPHHPLGFLVDRESGKWLSRSHLDHDPGAHAGHVYSKHAGGERLAVEDAFLNIVCGNRVGENRWGHAAIDRGDAVLIRGIPVDRRTAEMWERMHELPAGTVAAAPSHPGWYPNDPGGAHPGAPDGGGPPGAPSGAMHGHTTGDPGDGSPPPNSAAPLTDAVKGHVQSMKDAVDKGVTSATLVGSHGLVDAGIAFATAGAAGLGPAAKALGFAGLGILGVGMGVTHQLATEIRHIRDTVTDLDNLHVTPEQRGGPGHDAGHGDAGGQSADGGQPDATKSHTDKDAGAPDGSAPDGPASNHGKPEDGKPDGGTDAPGHQHAKDAGPGHDASGSGKGGDDGHTYTPADANMSDKQGHESRGYAPGNAASDHDGGHHAPACYDPGDDAAAGTGPHGSHHADVCYDPGNHAGQPGTASHDSGNNGAHDDGASHAPGIGAGHHDPAHHDPGPAQDGGAHADGLNYTPADANASHPNGHDANGYDHSHDAGDPVCQ